MSKAGTELSGHWLIDNLPVIGEQIRFQSVIIGEMAANPLDPSVLAKVESLYISAKKVAEGVIAGLHSSPHKGSSIEFSEHKEYSPGDDTRLIDWRLYAKSDKYYIKQFEDETNLKAVIALDASGSMRYIDSPWVKEKARPKFEYAVELAATLAYLLIRQQDAVGLYVFNEDQQYIPPRVQRSHLNSILERLATLKPEGKANLPEALTSLAQKIPRKTLVFVISDLFDDEDMTINALKLLSARGSADVTLFQVMHPDELTFPFDKLMRFMDMEGGPNLTADPNALRRDYLKELDCFQEKYSRSCIEHGMGFFSFDTSVDLSEALYEALVLRERYRKAR